MCVIHWRNQLGLGEVSGVGLCGGVDQNRQAVLLVFPGRWCSLLVCRSVRWRERGDHRRTVCGGRLPQVYGGSLVASGPPGG